MVTNLFLMLVWAAFWNDFTLWNLAVGFLLGYGVLSGFAVRGVTGPNAYIRRTRRAVALLAFFAWELVLSNLRMAADVLRPGLRMRPGVVAVPLDELTDTDAEITLLANLISLTPGTLLLDVSEDKRTLYIHTMDVADGDLDAFRRHIKRDFERRVQEVFH